MAVPSTADPASKQVFSIRLTGSRLPKTTGGCQSGDLVRSSAGFHGLSWFRREHREHACSAERAVRHHNPSRGSSQAWLGREDRGGDKHGNAQCSLNDRHGPDGAQIPHGRDPPRIMCADYGEASMAAGGGWRGVWDRGRVRLFKESFIPAKGFGLRFRDRSPRRTVSACSIVQHHRGVFLSEAQARAAPKRYS